MITTLLVIDAPCWCIEEIWLVWINSDCSSFASAGCECWSPWLMWLALGNILLVGMVAVAQTSFKSMISSGSVMHMGYCFLGIGACSALGAGSAIMLMCAHGLSVALMFLLASFVHKRTNTFEMSEMGGLGGSNPSPCLFLHRGDPCDHRFAWVWKFFGENLEYFYHLVNHRITFGFLSSLPWESYCQLCLVCGQWPGFFFGRQVMS